MKLYSTWCLGFLGEIMRLPKLLNLPKFDSIDKELAKFRSHVTTFSNGSNLRLLISLAI